MLTGSLVTDASKNIILEISVNAASVSLLLMALPPFYVISEAMTPNVKFPRRQPVNGRWKKVHSVHLLKGCVKISLVLLLTKFVSEKKEKLHYNN